MTEIHVLVLEDGAETCAHLAGYVSGANGVATFHASPGNKPGNLDLIPIDSGLARGDLREWSRKLRDACAGRPRIAERRLQTAAGGGETGPERRHDGIDLGGLASLVHEVLSQGAGSSAAWKDEHPGTQDVWRFGGFAFFPARRYATAPSGVRIPLTGAENDLLLALCQNARRTVTREELISLTKERHVGTAMRSVDILISRLRNKMRIDDPMTDHIRTIRNKGYFFQPEVERS